MVSSFWKKERRLRAAPFRCFRLNRRLGLSRLPGSFRLGREGCVAFAADEDGVALALLVREGRADGFAALVVRAVFEDVEGRNLFCFGRFGLSCHSCFSFFRVFTNPRRDEAPSAMRQGAASHRK